MPTNGNTPGSGGAGGGTGDTSGLMNLTINLPENIRISLVDSDDTEENDVAGSNATGTIVAFAGGTAPTGWLLCNGAAISRTTYADLFAVIGTDYGLGNANTTFNLPDFRGRFMLGLDNMGGVSANRVTSTEADRLGGSDGAEKHTLTIAELPRHTHRINERTTSGGAGTTYLELGRTDNTGGGRGTYRDIAEDIGGDQAHNNMPPYQTVNYIIKT